MHESEDEPLARPGALRFPSGMKRSERVVLPAMAFVAFVAFAQAFSASAQAPAPGAPRIARSAAPRLALTDRATCALATDSRLMCWGSLGPLGGGASAPRPREIRSTVPFVRIDGGAVGVCALTADGSLRCAATEGDGSSVVPEFAGGLEAPLPLPAPALELAVGLDFVCARLVDGRVACGGFLPSPTGSTCRAYTSDVPCTHGMQPVEGVSGATAIAAGTELACAIDGARRVLCWGRNAGLALGSLDAREDGVARPVAGVEGAIAIAVGMGFACAARDRGDVVCWGNRLYPDDPDGAATAHALARIPLPALAGARTLTARDDTVCGVIDGVLRCVAPPRPPRPTPLFVHGRRRRAILHAGGYVPNPIVADFPGATSIVPTRTHSCFVSDRGSVLCSGDNESGAVGDPWHREVQRPIQVLDASFTPAPDSARAVEPLDPPGVVDAYAPTPERFEFEPLPLSSLRPGVYEPNPASMAALIRATLAWSGSAVRTCIGGTSGEGELVLEIEVPPETNRAARASVEASSLGAEPKACVERVVLEIRWPRSRAPLSIRLPIALGGGGSPR